MMISRSHWFAITAILALASAGHTIAAPPTLTMADVNTIIGQAAQAAAVLSPNSVIAVTDREGFVLGVYGVSGPPASAQQIANAIAKAGTAAFLSSGGEAFTTRTAGFIIQPHFPPGIMNTSTGPLVGVGFSSLPFSDINHFRNPATTATISPSLGIPGTSLSGNPGGVPLYKGAVLVGGVGVDANTTFDALNYIPGGDVDENIAVSGQTGFAPPAGILATQVLLNGIRLPYTDFSGGASGVAVLNPANFATAYPATASPGTPFVPPGAALPYPQPSPFPDIPGGEVRDPIISSPIATSVGGQSRLTAAEVSTILHQAAVRASQTRGAIRNPIGPAEVFIVVVDYYATDGAGTPLAPAAPLPPPSLAPYAFPRPQVLGSFRTPDATIFSYDVAAQKARTALFFSNNTIALSSRAVGFLAEPTYPPGIDGTTAGPYNLLQNALSASDPTNVNQAINHFLPNGITIFPGGFPLYRKGVLIGAIGVSGDGVDQDDIISAAGTVGFEAPASIRSDEYTYRGARLPYAKFPQNASL
jgi:uncharacterized protein GlcG (DUF336 family)